MKKILPGWLFLPLTAVYSEALLYLWTAAPVSLVRLAVVAAFAAGFGGLFSLLAGLLPRKGEKGVSIAVCLITAVLYLMEYFMDDAYQTFMPLSVAAAGAGGVATGFFSTVVSLLLRNWWRIALFLLPTAVCCLLTKFQKRSRRIQSTLAGAVFALWAVALALVCLVTGDAAGMGPDYAFDPAVRSFGLSAALPLEALHGSGLISQTPDFVIDEPTQPTEQTQPTETTESTESTEPTEAETQPTQPPVIYGKHALPVNFAQLAQTERNSAVAAIHAYVASQRPAWENEYTGLFAGKNLIFITAEAFCGEFLDPELTPALWRLSREGIYFSDYYQPAWGASTTGGEYSNLTGLVPNGGQCMQEAVQQDLFLTMGNQLQAQGYFSAAYHNNDYTYYNRHRTHVHLGYDSFTGYGNGMQAGVTRAWPQSDLEMIDFTIPQHLENQPFSLYYMTVSGHSEYNRGNAMAKKNYEAVADLPWSEAVKCYIACNLELEKAVASLIAQLEAAGIADDTVIVISSDHYPYGLAESDTWGTTRNYLNELFGEDTRSDLVRDRNQLIIWSGCVEDLDIVVDSPVSSLDILPTLSNLFGLEYDSRLMPGRDVFSDQEALVFWPSGSWKTELASYDAGTKTLTYARGVSPVEGYEERIRDVVRNKMTYCRSVASCDYFNYVAAALEEN